MSSMTDVFGSTPKGFPSWNNPDPSAYFWTVSSKSHWFFSNTLPTAFSGIANLVLGLDAWFLHLAILVASKFSDPSWITDPVVAKVATIFKSGYENIFVKFLPILLMMFVGYLAWKYVVAHHTKMLTGMLSTLLATGLIAFFFFDFGTAFKWINGAGNLITDTAATAIASTAGTKVSSEYDALWNTYVLYPWEYEQFGQFSPNVSDYNVSSAFCPSGLTIDTAPGYCKYTPDPTASVPNPSQNSALITPQDNWVKLYLTNTSSDARTTLEQDLQDAVKNKQNPFADSSFVPAKLMNVNPLSMIVFFIVEFLLIIAPIAFLIFIGFQLFVRELLFIITLMRGLVAVPLAFVPEIGWSITFKWLREGIGHQVERLSNAIYGAILFAIAGIVTVTAGTTIGSMTEAFLVNAILFIGALLYRQKIFSMTANPMADAARGVDTHQGQRMTSDEYAKHQHEREMRGEHHSATKGGVAGAARRKLAENFEHHQHHEASTRHILDREIPMPARIARGSDEQPTLEDEWAEKERAKYRAAHYGHYGQPRQTEAQPQAPTGVRGRLADLASTAAGGVKGAVSQHLQDVRNPGRPLSHDERIRAREQGARRIEQKVHDVAIGSLVGALRQVSVLKAGGGGASDGPPPPDPPDEPLYRYAVAVSYDGRTTQRVALDANDNPVWYEPPVTRPDPGNTDANHVPPSPAPDSSSEAPSGPLDGSSESDRSIPSATRETVEDEKAEPQSTPGVSVRPPSNVIAMDAARPDRRQGSSNGRGSISKRFD